MTGPLLTCTNLEVGYGGQAILPRITLSISPGELWAVVGVNGSGKTTWMRTVLGLDAPVSGTTQISPETRPAYVPQMNALDPIFPIRVKDLVRMGRQRSGHYLGRGSAEDEQACREALRRVRAENLWDRAFRDLSGGQKQRTLLARALASGAQLFFLDEPTSGLDRQTESDVFELIGALRSQPGAAVVLITHHLQVLRGLADRALLLDREQMHVETGPAADVMKSDSFLQVFGDLSQMHVHAPVQSPSGAT